jgi:hypothetical protein
MADDTIDQARKIQEQLNETIRKGGKNATLTADQIRILTKGIGKLSDQAASATKSFSSFESSLEDVNTAFANPANTFQKMMDKGVESGEDLLKTFGAIAGLVFDGAINNANKALDKEKAILADLEKARQKEITIGEDSVKNLEEKLKKEKDFCDKVTKCDDSKIKSLEDQIKKESEKVTKQKEGGSLDDEAIKDQTKKIEKAEEFLKKQKAIAEVVKEFIASFGEAFDRFVKLDQAAADFRKELGLGRDIARGLEQTALQLNQQFVSLGVTIEGAYKSLKAIGSEFGTALLINKELAQTTALLAANYGVSEGNAAGFLQKMSSIGGMTDKQASAMAGFTANLANAAGVNLDEVMRDVANASDDTVTLMRGNVKQMTMAAIQAKQMGVSLDKSASSAKGLLNFTQSVSDEMEASVLLGKNLNLNAARQLSFQGDVAGAQKEILNQVRQMGDFNKMNVFQQEALAKATGYSAVELTKMLKNEEKLAQLSDKEKASYEKALEAMKEQNEETGKDLLMKTQMQSAMAQLSNTFQSFKQILADILTPVVNVAVKLLVPALKIALVVFNLLLVPIKVLANALYKMWEPIEPLVQSFSDSLDGANKFIEEIVQKGIDFGVVFLKINSSIMLFGAMFKTFLNPIELVFKGIGGIFSMINSGASRLLSPISGIINAFGSASGVVGKFASGFGNVTKVVGILGTAGKAIPVVGTVITVLQAVWGLFSRISNGMGIFDALGEVLYDVFVGPFELLVDLLSKIPVIGKLFEDIKPVFGMIKSGFSSVFGFIQEIFDGGFSGLWDKIVNGAKSFVSMIGSLLLIGIKSFGQLLYNLFIQPWVSAWNFISDLFVGKSNSTLGDGIIKGLIGVGSAILSIFTSPFEFIFGMIMKGFASIGAFIQNVLSVPFKIVGKLIGVDTGGIGTGAEAVASPQSDMIAAIEQTNQKLDTLISLMMNGGIAVNLDGRKVSEQLAIASS